MKPTYSDLELLLSSAEACWTNYAEKLVLLRAELDVAVGERDTARQERDVCRALRDGGLR